MISLSKKAADILALLLASTTPSMAVSVEDLAPAPVVQREAAILLADDDTDRPAWWRKLGSHWTYQADWDDRDDDDDDDDDD